MELTKKILHMDRTKCEATTQFSMEEDMNIPDSRPDVSQLIFDRGTVEVEEVRPGADSVIVRGAVYYVILYQTLEEGCSLVSLTGKLPFEEKVVLRGCTALDTVDVEPAVEDLTVGVINSRKLNLQTLVTLTVSVGEFYDEEIPILVTGDEGIQFCRQTMPIAELAICKNDIFRVREEALLPGGYPNGVQILWEHVTLQDMTFRCMEEKLSVAGDVKLFVLYEGEGEKHPIRSFETVFHIRGEMECQGCREGMIPHIEYTCGHTQVSLSPDVDGELRSLELDMVIDIRLKLYEEEEVSMLTDLYSTTSEVSAVERQGSLIRDLSNVTGKYKLVSKEKVPSGNILQLLHAEAEIFPEQQICGEKVLKTAGNLKIKLLYITGQDEAPYGHASFRIPYEYTMEIPTLREGEHCSVQAQLDQLQAGMLDGENVELKAVLSFTATAFYQIPVALIDHVEEAPLLPEKRKSLPGMAIYVVKDGDTLWSIGKKYYCTVDSLRKVNDLEKDELVRGQKVLVVKG